MTNPRPAHSFRRAIDSAALIAATAGRTLVVIAPHPDDETLGAGRLIARALRARVRVAVVVLTDGDASHPGSRRWPALILAALRRGELRRALARLGAGSAAVRFLHWHDGNVDRDGRALALRRLLTKLGAGVVLAPSPRDHHPDHQAAWRLAVAATRGGRPPVDYAVWSRLGGGSPAREPHTAAKRWAALAHRSQTTRYIADDPGGFVLAPRDLAAFVGEAERFTTPRSRRRPATARRPDRNS